MYAISSTVATDPQTNKPTNKQTGPITIHCAAKLSVQCNLTALNPGNLGERGPETYNNNNNNCYYDNANDKKGQFLRRLSIALQRFNAILLHESFESDVDPDL